LTISASHRNPLYFSAKLCNGFGNMTQKDSDVNSDPSITVVIAPSANSYTDSHPERYKNRDVLVSLADFWTIILDMSAGFPPTVPQAPARRPCRVAVATNPYVQFHPPGQRR